MPNTTSELIADLAATFRDYRQGEIPPIDTAHVQAWIEQFAGPVREQILGEMHHIFVKKGWYLTKKDVAKAVRAMTSTEKLAGPDPAKFWRSVGVLNIQQNGESQGAMIEMLAHEVSAAHGVDISEGDERADTFVYIDDFIFSGSRLTQDLKTWLENDPPDKATVHILVLGYYAYAQWKRNEELVKIARENGIGLDLHWWHFRCLEDRRYYIDNSDVLRPAAIPQDPLCQQYYQELQTGQYPPTLRTPGRMRNNEVFSSEEGRSILEAELFKAGMRIRSFSKSPAKALRPLGFQGFNSFGFGAMIATYRNCPNNCPLALWWGDPTASSSHPFSKWQPLLPRKTYEG